MIIVSSESSGKCPRAAGERGVFVRAVVTQLGLVLLINVPSISFGLAMGWVSLESGAVDGDGGDGALVAAAAVTFVAGALAAPAAARALAAGRKPAMLATSAAFIVCWALKLCGGWGVLAGRAAAGLGGTAAWVIPPMLALEMCSPGVRGAAAVALVLAHNVGFLLMYLAADYDVPHRTVLLCCLGLSVTHFIAYMFVPESPAYLAANGRLKEARVSLAWCRGLAGDSTSAALDAELRTLPAPDLEPVSPLRLAKDMLSDVRRRKAFLIALVAVVGQEMCGVLTLLQFAERVFTLAREGQGEEGQGEGEGRPSGDAVVLGVVQLVGSALALYLVERIGRRPLLVWGALSCGLGLAAGAGCVLAGWRRGALATLAAAVFADSAGLQPAPYALLAEMFTYQYRGCASLLVTVASDLANAAELGVFPGVARAAGLGAALALAAALTLALAAFAAALVPETRGRHPHDIYDELGPPRPRDEDNLEAAAVDATDVNSTVDGDVSAKDRSIDGDNNFLTEENLEIKNIKSVNDCDDTDKTDDDGIKIFNTNDGNKFGKTNAAFVDDQNLFMTKDRNESIETVPKDSLDKMHFTADESVVSSDSVNSTASGGENSSVDRTVQVDNNCKQSSKVIAVDTAVESTHF